jgi:hypothetical protein
MTPGGLWLLISDSNHVQSRVTVVDRVPPRHGGLRCRWRCEGRGAPSCVARTPGPLRAMARLGLKSRLMPNSDAQFDTTVIWMHSGNKKPSDLEGFS